MDKTAQKRSIPNILREKINMPKSYLDRFFAPELKKSMDKIVEVDDSIRAELTGSKIGKARSPADKTSAKELIKSAKMHFNRKEYMPGFKDISHFRKKMITIIQLIKSIDIKAFGLDPAKIDSKYLFGDMSPEELATIKEHMNLTASDVSHIFIKEAGIFDAIHNIVTTKGRALSSWEKQSEKNTKKLKDNGFKLIDSAQDVLSGVISDLKGMAHFRAIRNPVEYVRVANNIVKQFSEGFDTEFNVYKTEIIDPFIRKHEELIAAEDAKQAAEALEAEKLQRASQVAQTPIVAPQQATTTPTVVAPLTGVPAMLGGPEAAPPPKQLSLEQVDPVTGLVTKVTHKDFFNSLKVFSNETPQFLASYIFKYAKSIQHEDLETAIKLFNIVKQIKG